MSPLGGAIYVKLNISNAQHSLRGGQVTATSTLSVFSPFQPVITGVSEEEKPGNIVVMGCWWVLSGFIGQFQIDTTSYASAVWHNLYASVSI